MIEIILELIIAGCGLVTMVSLIMVIREILMITILSHLTLSDIPVKKTTFCQLVLDWCHEHLGNPITSKPSLTLKYGHQKKLAGVFISSSNECQIYIRNHKTLMEITNTVIHEYVHSLQSSKSFDRMYSRYQKDFGYENNPFEIESRELANKYERPCLLWVCQQFDKKTS